MQDLYVRAEFRRLGIASSFVKYLFEQSSKKGSPSVNWLCLRSNENALKFYNRIGGVISNTFLYQIDLL